MTARIYKPAATAMQQGAARGKWLLEHDLSSPRVIEPLMGYTASSDMESQVKLRFDTREAAVAHAVANGIAYRVIEPHETTAKTAVYSDNFKFDRVGQWTH